jgi:ABC-type dipeptide/oligopeptide/nickel transport system ATPase component
MPKACRFADRCPWVEDICREIVPMERKIGRNHTAACHLACEIKKGKNDFI